MFDLKLVVKLIFIVEEDLCAVPLLLVQRLPILTIISSDGLLEPLDVLLAVCEYHNLVFHLILSPNRCQNLEVDH